MSFTLNWHAIDGLCIKAMYPENSGSITLADGKGSELSLYLPMVQWQALYAALPKAQDFVVFRSVGAAIKNEAKADAFLSELAKTREAA